MITPARICLSIIEGITLSQKTKGYLPHPIRFKFKHPKVLDFAKVKFFLIVCIFKQN